MGRSFVLDGAAFRVFQIDSFVIPMNSHSDSILTSAAAGSDAARETVYMGETVRLAATANEAVVNQAVPDNEQRVRHTSSKPYQLTERLWVLPGPVLNAAVIVGDDGLIVWEAGEHVEHGRQYRELIRGISDKPIKALIYSHTHYTLGASALIEGECDVAIIGHPMLNENMRVGAVGATFPELEPLQRARAVQHAQVLLPDHGEDARYGFVIERGQPGFVPVNTPVTHGQTLTVAGVNLQFFTEGGSDTDDCVTVWLPDEKVALNNILWPWQPNFYTPRGAKFRDPRIWAEALRHIQALHPEYLVSQHGRTLIGASEIERTLNNYLDFTMLVLDQTLRGILQAKGPDELRHFVELPRHLAEDPWLFEAYGRLDWHAPYIMNHAVGWWDGNAATLVRMPPQAAAERMVKLLGGRECVLAAVREAQASGELPWALELLDYLFRLAPDDAQIRQIKAELLRGSAQACTSSITRGFMLSQALALEGKIRLPRVLQPSLQQVCANPATFVDHLRVRVDPVKAQETDAVMRFDFTDGAQASVALHLRRGVVGFVADPARYGHRADYLLTLDSQAFYPLFTGQESLDALLRRNAVHLAGDETGACAFLAMFDSLQP